jgi:hypothetical protein
MSRARPLQRKPRASQEGGCRGRRAYTRLGGASRAHQGKPPLSPAALRLPGTPVAGAGHQLAPPIPTRLGCSRLPGARRVMRRAACVPQAAGPPAGGQASSSAAGAGRWQLFFSRAQYVPAQERHDPRPQASGTVHNILPAVAQPPGGPPPSGAGRLRSGLLCSLAASQLLRRSCCTASARFTPWLYPPSPATPGCYQPQSRLQPARLPGYQLPATSYQLPATARRSSRLRAAAAGGAARRACAPAWGRGRCRRWG